MPGSGSSSGYGPRRRRREELGGNSGNVPESNGCLLDGFTHHGQQPLRLVAVPGSPIAIGFDSYSVQRSETPAPAISTRLWSSEYGDVLFGLSVNEYQEGDSLFGDVGRDPKKKKTYRAILAFDQPLGFSTAISMDVLSKDQRRGLTKFQLFQIGVTHPF